MCSAPPEPGATEVRSSNYLCSALLGNSGHVNPFSSSSQSASREKGAVRKKGFVKMRAMILLKPGINLSNLKDDPFQKCKVSALRLSVT